MRGDAEPAPGGKFSCRGPVMAGLDAHMSVGYVTNQMLGRGLNDARGLGIVIAAYEGLQS